MSMGMDVGGSGANGTAVVSRSTAIGLGAGEVAPGNGATDSQATSLTGCVDAEELGSPVEDVAEGVSRIIFYHHPNIVATHRVAITLLYIKQNVYGPLWVPCTI